jgi:CHAT domain-containing protein/tetratricopeptide (TPR) repeat protein
MGVTALGVLIAAQGLTAAVPPPGGVEIETVAPASPAAKAGAQIGDRLVSWSRAASAAAPAAAGEIRSPFDLALLLIEQTPRGAVSLHGRRGEAETSWPLAGPPPWGAETLPALPAALLALYHEGRQRIAAGDLDAGAESWRAAAAQALSGGDPGTAAWFHLRRARALSEAARWPAADTAFADAVAALRPAAPAAAAQVLREQGEALQRRSAWDGAMDGYNRALALDRAVAPESLAVAADLTGLGTTAGRKGDLGGSTEPFRQALALRERLAPDSVELAGSLRNLGVTAGRQGDLTASEEYLRRALAVLARAAPGSTAEAAVLNNLGNVALIHGDLAAGDDLYRRSLAIYEATDPASEDVARGLSNLGLVAMYRSDLATADDFLRRALAIQEKRVPENLELANTLNNLGTVAGRRGEIEAAEAHHRRALELRERLAPGSPDVAESLGNLGAIARDRGDFATAADILQRALALHDKLSPGSLYGALDRHLLTLVAIDRGDWQTAAATLRQAQEIADRQAPGGILASDLAHDLGSMAAKQGDLATAEAGFRRSLAVRERIAPGSIRVATALHDLGVVLRRAGRRDEAAAALCGAADTLDRQRATLGGTDEGRSAFSASFADFYHQCLAARVEMGQPEAAFDVLERGRARSFLALLAQRTQLATTQLSPELARERREVDTAYDRAQGELSRLTPGKDGAAIETRTALLRELSTRREELVARLRRDAPRFAALQEPAPLPLAQARAALDPGTLLLAFSVGEEESFLFAVTAANVPGPGLTVFRLPGGGSALREEITAFRNLLQRDGSDRKALAARAARLYDSLLRPADALIARAGRLLVLPSGPLHTLPFAALVRNGHYLAERKAVHTALSATVYAELRRERRPAPEPGELQLAAFGDPSYPAGAPEELTNPQVRDSLRGGLNLSPLPASRREVEGVAALYPGARVYLGAAATEENAKAMAPAARLVHFACHGLLDERFPLNSALALTIPKHPAPGQDNGLLQAWEIFESVHLDADLVTLSACGSGLGKEMGGEGLIGLTRAFQYAGARSVLASLWSVSDSSTAALMRRFYGYLRQGKSKDEALRAAQLDLIHGPASASHPYHWAAFQLSGDWK